tara:strand:- start:1559 stop:1741 length:183 start_codon:yes stop_codon:yes gene_type:complete
MNKEDLEKILDIRNQIIAAYNALEHKNEAHAIISQKKVAQEFELLIKKIDNILEGKVKFV